MFVTRIWIVLAVLLVLVSAALSNARTSSGAGHETRHRVKAGETLWVIAAANYAGDPREGVWKLRQRNHLVGTTLRLGQTLVLPG